MKTVIITLFLAGLLFALSRVLIRWQASRIANRLIDEGLHPERHPAKSQGKLQPESRFIVHLSEQGVSCERPDGQVERVAWDDLQSVEILTTPDGPFWPDIFWLLSGTDTGCVIPWGATGDRELLERLQRLPRFDNGTVITSAPRTEGHRTLCWRRSPNVA
jgi:hypothetical protein